MKKHYFQYYQKNQDEFLKDLKKSNYISLTVSSTLKEDLGEFSDISSDITGQLISSNNYSQAVVITRESGIFCGKHWIEEVFKQLGKSQVDIVWHVDDGDIIKSNQVIFKIFGPSCILLAGERTALNFSQTLSGVSTQVSRYLKYLEGTSIRILDTRKTLPGLRKALKYAVLCGGGINHRMGLYDAILIKENHIKAYGSLSKIIKKAVATYPTKIVEVEVQKASEIEDAIKSGAGIILLDNFCPSEIYNAVEINNRRVLLEVSGNITLHTIQQFKNYQVDFISVGEITKDIKSLDLSMQFV